MYTQVMRLPIEAVGQVLATLGIEGKPDRNRNSHPANSSDAAWGTAGKVEVFADHGYGVSVTAPSSHPCWPEIEDVKRQYETSSPALAQYRAAVKEAASKRYADDLAARKEMAAVMRRYPLHDSDEAVAARNMAVREHNARFDAGAREWHAAVAAARARFREAWTAANPPRRLVTEA